MNEQAKLFPDVSLEADDPDCYEYDEIDAERDARMTASRKVLEEVQSRVWPEYERVEKAAAEKRDKELLPAKRRHMRECLKIQAEYLAKREAKDGKTE